ncbi:MAG: cell division protein FtsL [Bacillota bacterium]
MLRRKKRKKAKPAVGVTILLLLLTGLALGTAVQYTIITRAEIALRNDRARLEELMRQSQWLEVELASRTAPSRIEEVAVTKLGMVRPQQVRVLASGSQSASAASVVWGQVSSGGEGILEKLLQRVSQGIQRAQAKPKR